MWLTIAECNIKETTAIWNRRESVEMLLDAGADVNFRNDGGRTPFDRALDSFRVKPLEIPLIKFLENDANIVNTFRTVHIFSVLVHDYITEESNEREQEARELALHAFLQRVPRGAEYLN
jgi:hypothetical protein